MLVFAFFHAPQYIAHQLAWSPLALRLSPSIISSHGLYPLSKSMSINRTSEFRKVLAEKKVSTPEPHRRRAPRANPGKDVFNKEYLKEGYAVVRRSHRSFVNSADSKYVTAQTHHHPDTNALPRPKTLSEHGHASSRLPPTDTYPRSWELRRIMVEYPSPHERRTGPNRLAGEVDPD